MPGAVLSLFDVLVAEYEAQGTQPPFPREDFEARRRQGEPDSALVAGFYAWLHANGVRRSALCFSGGGIRSATFGLGIVQGLARAGLAARHLSARPVQRPPRLVAGQSGPGRRADLEYPRPAVRAVVAALRGVRPHRRPAPVRLPLGRRALREPGPLRDDPAPLPFHRGLRRRAHPSFPHESTADQLYTEPQFESYRELGSHVMSTILAGLPPEASLADLFEMVRKGLGIPV